MSFAIVHKNKVIIGPMDWKQKYFTDVLKIRHKVESNIPAVVPVTLPYIIDEDTYINRVIENKPEIDFMTEYHYGPLWNITSDAVIANYEVKDIEISDARNNFRVIAANERYKKEVSGLKITIQDTGVSIDTSRDGRRIFTERYIVMSDNEIINWKFPEAWLELSKTDIRDIIISITSYVQSVFDWEKSINIAIDSAQTKEQLKDISMV